MDVAIVGAGGAIGRQVAIALVSGRILPSSARLQLVGRPGSVSQQLLPGLARDLLDAYAETAPQIQVITEIDDLVADIVIMCAGATVPPRPDANPDRTSLAAANWPIAQSVARHIADHGHGEEPTGSHQSGRNHRRCRLPLLTSSPSYRHGWSPRQFALRGEIAEQLGVRRQAVQALVLGEHGMGMVPCWSTVSAFGFDHPVGRERIHSLLPNNAVKLPEAAGALLATHRDHGTAAAYAALSQYDAGARAFLRPVVTHCSGARTPVGSAAMISDLISGLQLVATLELVAQVQLDGEFLDIHGVTGAPVVVTNRGVEHIEQLTLTADEISAIQAAATRSNSLLEQIV